MSAPDARAPSARIAVTGASGYLGGRVVARLRAAGIDAVACPGLRDGFDLADREATKRFFAEAACGTIVHCAAAVPKTPAEYMDGSAAERSVAIAAAVASSGVPHVVFSSSMTVYPADARMPVREEDAADDAAGYAGGKLAAERALCGAPGMVATALRLPGLFGPPRQGGLLYNAALAFARRRIFPLPHPAPLWAALHVDDAADLLVRAALDTPAETRILNAGYGEAMSVTRTVSQLAARFGVVLPEDGAPEFEMDLTRLDAAIGRPAKTLAERLDEIAALARIAAEPARA